MLMHLWDNPKKHKGIFPEPPSEKNHLRRMVCFHRCSRGAPFALQWPTAWHSLATCTPTWQLCAHQSIPGKWVWAGLTINTPGLGNAKSCFLALWIWVLKLVLPHKFESESILDTIFKPKHGMHLGFHPIFRLTHRFCCCFGLRRHLACSCGCFLCLEAAFAFADAFGFLVLAPAIVLAAAFGLRAVFVIALVFFGGLAVFDFGKAPNKLLGDRGPSVVLPSGYLMGLSCTMPSGISLGIPWLAESIASSWGEFGFTIGDSEREPASNSVATMGDSNAWSAGLTGVSNPGST